jgi:hypothetical protein
MMYDEAKPMLHSAILALCAAEAAGELSEHDVEVLGSAHFATVGATQRERPDTGPVYAWGGRYFARMLNHFATGAYPDPS